MFQMHLKKSYNLNIMFICVWASIEFYTVAQNLLEIHVGDLVQVA